MLFQQQSRCYSNCVLQAWGPHCWNFQHYSLARIQGFSCGCVRQCKIRTLTWLRTRIHETPLTRHRMTWLRLCHGILSRPIQTHQPQRWSTSISIRTRRATGFGSWTTSRSAPITTSPFFFCQTWATTPIPTVRNGTLRILDQTRRSE